MQIKIKVKDAIGYAGSITKLAKLLNVSRQAIHLWKKPDVPQSSAWKLYYVTDKKLGVVVE